MKYLLVGLMFLLLITPACSQKEEKPQVNTSKIDSYPPRPEGSVLAPDFTLLNSVTRDLVKMQDLLGKVVLLNFWGTWCGPCKIEIPDFNKLYKDHRKDGLEIVGVTLTSGSANDIATFANDWNMEYLVLSDITGNETQQVSGMVGKAVGQQIYAVPTTFSIDREGYIVKGYIGPRTHQEFLKDIIPYL